MFKKLNMHSKENTHIYINVWKIQQYIQSMWNAGEEFNVAFWVFHDHMNLYYWMESGPM